MHFDCHFRKFGRNFATGGNSRKILKKSFVRIFFFEENNSNFVLGVLFVSN